MDKILQAVLIVSSVLFFSSSLSAQQGDKVIDNTKTPPALYSSIDFEENTPCNCSQKTDRTRQLSKGLLDQDLKQYDLHPYTFSFKNNDPQGWAKLFKAMESDPTIYKVSVKEWDSFMLLTTPGFDVAAFEMAAQKALDNFSVTTPDVYLKAKNTALFNTYMLQQTIEENNQTR
jgi:hypothetical protein